MNRRSFLAFLGLAPLAPIAVKSAPTLTVNPMPHTIDNQIRELMKGTATRWYAIDDAVEWNLVEIDAELWRGGKPTIAPFPRKAAA